MNTEENINLQEAKKRFQFQDIPKKYIAIGAGILVVLFIIAIVTGGQKKLSGSYVDKYNNRYEFQITDSRQGEYGGTLNEYSSSGDLSGSFVWYMEDSIVYVNGKQTYRYDGTYLFYPQPTKGFTVEADNVISGYNSNWEDERSGGILFTNLVSNDCAFYKDGYFGPEIEFGTYEIKDSIVKIYDDSGKLFQIYIIIENELYKNILSPI